MAVEQGNDFLSQSWQMKDAFQKMNYSYPGLLSELMDEIPLRPQVWKRATLDYVLAGLAWFANRSDDPYLGEIGTTALQLEQQQVIPLIPVDDIQKALRQWGFDEEEVARANPLWPLQITQPFEGGLIQKGGATAFLPFTTVFEAQEYPIRALGKIATLASQMSDFINNRFKNPVAMAKKGVASYIYVLGKAHQMYPDFALSPNERKILSDFFPDGIDLLPEYMRGHRIDGNQIPNYRLN